MITKPVTMGTGWELSVIAIFTTELPSQSHNNVHQPALSQQIQACSMYMRQGPYFFLSLVPRNAIWWVLIIKLTFGKHASKGNQSTKFTIAEQSRKWAILRGGFYWAVNEASGPEIKYHFITEGQGMWQVRNQVWDVRMMSGWHVINGHYVNWDWQQHNI